ncbi:MAG: prepilin peptidase [Oscillospiraceae bacterium]|nr:prepilin peptidase [Oscillospiraceae bacterium]
MPFEIFIIVILFVYGTIIGSFLNVVIYRTAKKEQFVKGRSRCMSCNRTIAWYDLFPVLSWLLLRGKCRHCKAAISPRYAVVESLCGLSYVAAFLTLGVSFSLAVAVVLFPVLICLSFFDIDTGEIEYWCPATIAALGIVAIVLPLFGVVEAMSPWYEHLLGAVVISVPFAVFLFFGAMGGADVQLMAAAGLLLGRNIVPAAFIAILVGAIGGIIIKATDKSKSLTVFDDNNESNMPDTLEQNAQPSRLPSPKGTVMPFGPYLAFGIACGFLFGGEIVGWYLSFMGH